MPLAESMASHRKIYVLLHPLEPRRLLSAAAFGQPMAQVSAANDLASSGNYDFIVTYSGSGPIAGEGNSNIKVTGPGGFSQDASLLNVSSSDDTAFATYQITPAG